MHCDRKDILNIYCCCFIIHIFNVLITFPIGLFKWHLKHESVVKTILLVIMSNLKSSSVRHFKICMCFSLVKESFSHMAQTANPLFHCKKKGNLEALDIFTSCENSHNFKQAEQKAEGKFAGCLQDVVHTVGSDAINSASFSIPKFDLRYSNSNMPSVQECM